MNFKMYFTAPYNEGPVLSPQTDRSKIHFVAIWLMLFETALKVKVLQSKSLLTDFEQTPRRTCSVMSPPMLLTGRAHSCCDLEFGQLFKSWFC